MSSGEKLGGVSVSAKREGTTITTTVYTDESGNYYSPPLAAAKCSVRRSRLEQNHQLIEDGSNTGV